MFILPRTDSSYGPISKRCVDSKEMENVEDGLGEEWEDEEESAWSIRRSRVTRLMKGWFLCVWHCYEGVALVFDSPTTLPLSGNKMN